MGLAASEFWTLSAMQEAEPYPLPEVRGHADEMDALASAVATEPGEIVGVPPGEGEPPETEPTATTGGGSVSAVAMTAATCSGE